MLNQIKQSLIISLLAFLMAYASQAQLPADKLNVLFIAIDDLRPELGCYGSDIAISPNIDQLAAESLLFNNAYCQQAICGPSRASVLTGLRPETSGIIHNYLKIRQQNPDIVTLPQHFAANGYEAAYCGKIFHHGDRDDELSWNRIPDASKIDPPVKRYGGYALEENQEAKKANTADIIAKYGQGKAVRGLGSSGPAYEMAEVPDRTYIDGYNTELAISTMKDMIDTGKPFFLGLGFNKPHLNWVSPKKYWDLYDREDIQQSTQTEGPEGGAAMGLHASFELRVRHGIPKEGPIDLELATTLKHAYLACVSYVDAQIGQMIEALEAAGVRDRTVIVLWSDHGYHLGDMGVWGKATNYEIATRVPMIFWTPDMSKRSQGAKTNALVELVDLYPTLCELAGLELPEHLEGRSLTPLLANPKQTVKTAAFSQFPTPALREWGAYPLSPEMRETFFGPLVTQVETRIKDQMKGQWDRELFENYLMGYTMRTKRYRLVLWKDRRAPESEPLFVELYDHKTDPKETVNISLDQPKLVAKLSAQFDAEWKQNHN